MKLIVPFQSDKIPHYKTEVGLIFCSDARLTRLDTPKKSLLFRVVKALGFKMPDPIIVPGGAMDLRDPKSNAFQYRLESALKLWKLHGIETFYVVVHVNCGAYKEAGLIPEGVDEKVFLEKDVLNIMAEFKKALRENGCNVEVKPNIADFDGLWAVE